MGGYHRGNGGRTAATAAGWKGKSHPNYHGASAEALYKTKMLLLDTFRKKGPERKKMGSCSIR